MNKSISSDPSCPLVVVGGSCSSSLEYDHNCHHKPRIKLKLDILRNTQQTTIINKSTLSSLIIFRIYKLLTHAGAKLLRLTRSSFQLKFYHWVLVTFILMVLNSSFTNANDSVSVLTSSSDKSTMIIMRGEEGNENTHDNGYEDDSSAANSYQRLLDLHHGKSLEQFDGISGDFEGPRNFRRPLKHFSNSLEGTSAFPTSKEIMSEIPQSDHPSPQPDNNKAGKGQPKIVKSSKKVSPQTVIVPILHLINSSTSSSSSSSSSPQRILNNNPYLNLNNKTRINDKEIIFNINGKNGSIGSVIIPGGGGGGGGLGSGGPLVKPRRLESLSYGLKKNKNSISFVDEEDEEEIPTNSASILPSFNNNKVQDVEIIQRVRKATLQMRRDLSRLVASVGSGLDDDVTSLNSKCDHVFISTQGGPRNGSFESPVLPVEEGNLYTCMLMFVTRPNERVEISFDSFSVRGTPPECVHEWVDIWTEVEGTDPTDLITTPFSGRYCGRIPPRKRISLYGGIAIGFYSDKNATDDAVFTGTYAFINESKYMVGTPVPRTICSYTILGSSNKGIGELLSPTYPGVYPKNLSCSYKFIGTPGQRVRIEFRDFDVFYGGQHCPFDDVKIYDGPDPTAPLIGTYCGQQRNLVIYSSEHMMLVTFTTLDRTTDSQNRGFNAVYEFSNSFVKLDFIEKNMGEHIRGTECDQRILSKGQSAGVVYSPNYPFPYLPKIVCRYFIYGLQDQQNLERVRLTFEIFDVPSNINSAEDEVNQSEAKSRCGDGFVKVYLKGQEIIQAYDKADYEFCGKELPHSVVSDGPRMVLVFSSGETQGSGFKGKYTFETEYRVPGTEDPSVPCHFTYYSTSRQKGEFNSPRFPSNYPSDTNCTYMFYMESAKEQVRIVFDNFKLRADRFNYSDRGAYGSSCEDDWLEIWNVMNSGEERYMGRYCSTTAPGPIESKEQASALKIVMRTDEENVFSGFKARYVFFTPTSAFGEDCGGNISNSITGEILSPGWPNKYEGPSATKGDGSKTCHWYVTVRPGSRVLLHFQQFSVEGEPYARGCAAAAVRVWEDLDSAPIELCGEKLLPEFSQYVSTRNTMRVTFIMADKAIGAPGFKAIWTEVQDGATSTCHSSFFRCGKSQYCIPMDLKCDSTRNCGMYAGEPDTSDEDDSTCGIVITDMNFVFTVGVGVAIGILVIIVACAWGQRRKRRRRRRLQLRRPPIHVCDNNAGARFAAMDSV